MSSVALDKLQRLLTGESVASLSRTLPLSTYTLRRIKLGHTPSIKLPTSDINRLFSKESYARLKSTGFSVKEAGKLRSGSAVRIDASIQTLQGRIHNQAQWPMQKWQEFDKKRGINNSLEYYRKRAEAAVRQGYQASKKTFGEWMEYPTVFDEWEEAYEFGGDYSDEY